MLHGTSRRQSAQISIIGAGVAGTWQALLLSRAGFDVTLFERDDASLQNSTGYRAGGMLAPFCEAEATEPVVTRLGLRSLDLWDNELPPGPLRDARIRKARQRHTRRRASP